jgi:putative nucleotidyltransferase with HDIG domain
MERIDRILHHPAFVSALADIEQAEQRRIFCRHGLEHLLATARYMAILAAEEGENIPREVLYGAALLHDLGRAEEYRSGESHEDASLTMAAPILADCGYPDEEQAQILQAIGEHRSSYGEPRSPLGRLLYRGDKESRPCFACAASDQCNWPEEKKNHTILR